jgi:protein-S-isoprenylcysteine O-methyltransferase Ste14
MGGMSDFVAGMRRGFTSSRVERFRSTFAYDLLARIPLITWFAVCGVATLRNIINDFAAAPTFNTAETLKLLAGIAGLGFILLVTGALCLRMRPTARAAGLRPRIIAIAGTFSITALALLPRSDLTPGAALVSFVMICAGYAFACYALRHLGRSLSIMAEARRLVTTGPYAFIRHPLYAGEALASLGLLIQYLSPMAVLLWIIHISLQYRRLRYEENVLSQAFPGYGAYAGRVARLIPGVY